MEPLYSILLCNQDYSGYKEKIRIWLGQGIKVLWFTQNENELVELKSEYQAFSKALMLQCYLISFPESVCIIDGDDQNKFVTTRLEKECPLFNSAQYSVEHCKYDEHIVVQASAGTGKTTVMIDRILFLLHTQPSLHLPEVYMVTFTNDATDQMNKRLQDALLTRYELTRDKKYLRWLEEQSQMNISTIHSFAYKMLKEYGIGESFTKNLNIRSFKHEKSELVKDALDGKLVETKAIKEQLGMPFYKANGLLNQYWGRFLQLGVSHEDMLNMDWGAPKNENSELFHEVISDTIPSLDEAFLDIKRNNNGVGLDDIMRDLQEVFNSDYLPRPDLTMKYLFIVKSGRGK